MIPPHINKACRNPSRGESLPSAPASPGEGYVWYRTLTLESRLSKWAKPFYHKDSLLPQDLEPSSRIECHLSSSSKIVDSEEAPETMYLGSLVTDSVRLAYSVRRRAFVESGRHMTGLQAIQKDCSDYTYVSLRIRTRSSSSGSMSLA